MAGLYALGSKNIFEVLICIIVKLQKNIDLKLFHIKLDTSRFDRHIFLLQSISVYFEFDGL